MELRARPCFRCHLCRLLLLLLPLVLLSFCCRYCGLLGRLAKHGVEDREVPVLRLLLPWLRLWSWVKFHCLCMCRWCRLPAVQPLLQVSLICWILPWSSYPRDLLLCSCCRWCLLLPKVHSGFGRLLWSCPLWIPARQDVVQHRLRSWRCCRANGLSSCLLWMFWWKMFPWTAIRLQPAVVEVVEAIRVDLFAPLEIGSPDLPVLQLVPHLASLCSDPGDLPVGAVVHPPVVPVCIKDLL